MSYTTIDDPSAYFHTQIWTGASGSTVNVVNDGNSDLQPDFIWAKERTSPGGYAYNHNLVDSSRGVTKTLWSDTTTAEMTASQSNYDLQSFNTDGFTTGAPEYTNSLGGSSVTDGKVAWQWKCNGGTTSNLSGNLASVVQVNADAGFSIVKYTGSGGNGQSVLHGLGLTPEVIITKARNGVDDWYMYHKSIGNTKILKLNTTAAEASSSVYSAAAVSSSAFYVSTSLIYVGELGADFVSYCFAPIQGYSKFWQLCR